MNQRKIISWILILGGVAIIGWSLYSSYQIFSGKATAPEIFKVEEKEEKPLLEKGKTGLGLPELQEEMKETIREEIGKMVPPEFLANLLNLMSWSVFAGILIFGGSQLSSLGIKLLKKAIAKK